MQNKPKRNNCGYSLIELMTTIVVLAVVIGLLYGYENQGWDLYYKTFNRGLSQSKAKFSIKAITDDLREANQKRISIGRGVSYGVPFPKDAFYNSPYIYFTKPNQDKPSGEITSYNYVLYYFAEPKENENFTRRLRDEDKKLILKTLKFIEQSKIYTEDEEKTWPFMPPILEIYMSQLPEDKAFLDHLKYAENKKNMNEEEEGSLDENIELQPTPDDSDEYLDLSEKIKKSSRNVPLTAGYKSITLTDPFSISEVQYSFGNDYKTSKPITVKVKLPQGKLLGLNESYVEFESKVSPRN